MSLAEHRRRTGRTRCRWRVASAACVTVHAHDRLRPGRTIPPLIDASCAGVTRSTTVAGISIVPSAGPPATRLAPLASASSMRALFARAPPGMLTSRTKAIALPWRGSPGQQRSRPWRRTSRRMASAMASSTMIRSVDMQIWPWWAKAPKAAPFTAASRSASSSTIERRLAAELEQHRLQVLRRSVSAITRPTAVEPVKLTRRTAGWAIRAFDHLGRVGRARW